MKSEDYSKVLIPIINASLLYWTLHVWFHVEELILNPKLILHKFLHVRFHVEIEFKIDSKLKQL